MYLLNVPFVFVYYFIYIFEYIQTCTIIKPLVSKFVFCFLSAFIFQSFPNCSETTLLKPNMTAQLNSTMLSNTYSDQESNTSNCNVSGWNFDKITALTHLIICSPILIILTYLIYIFLKKYKKPTNNGEIIFLMMIIFSLVSFLQIGNMLLGDFLCVIRQNESSREIRSNIFISLGFAQLYTILFIFFMRFNLVLNGTVHKFTPCTLYSYYIAFIITGIGGICVCSMYMSVEKEKLFIPAAIFVMGLLGIITSMVITFISKLMQVNQSTQNDEELVSVITKIVLLTTMSILATILVGIFLALRVYMFSPIIMAGYWFMASIDAITSFLCLILSYRIFDNLYEILCKLPDRICSTCCVRRLNHKVQRENIEVKVANIINCESKRENSANSRSKSVDVIYKSSDSANIAVMQEMSTNSFTENKRHSQMMHVSEIGTL